MGNPINEEIQHPQAILPNGGVNEERIIVSNLQNQNAVGIPVKAT